MSVEDLEAKFLEHTAEERETQKSIADTLDCIRKFLFGNGAVGLDERVRGVEHVVAEWIKLKHWLMAGVGGIGIKVTFDIFVWYQESKPS